MASIFISYRRTDAAGHAGRLYDQLANRFGAANIFKDLDSMEPGADFAEVIEDTVARCDALIAVIGSDWLSSRLEDPDDWVRLEIANALARKVRVIPVLVEGAKMPAPSELPDDSSALTRRHAVDLSETGWHAQVTELLDRLETVLDADSEAPVAGPVPQVRRADARTPNGDLQEAGPPGTWKVDAHLSADRHQLAHGELIAPSTAVQALTLDMRSGPATHVLSLQDWDREREGKPIGPLAMLDGEELDHTPLVWPEPLLGTVYLWVTGVCAFRLETTDGKSRGILSYSKRHGVLQYVLLKIDGEPAYEHGDVPEEIRRTD
ncbi:MAG: toll/interleukin-1 receptor domain-containing protein [Thermoleophilaceae bacterium]